MIKQSIVNFFKNLKYFFTPLGTLFLGLIFGVFFCIQDLRCKLTKQQLKFKYLNNWYKFFIKLWLLYKYYDIIEV